MGKDKDKTATGRADGSLGKLTKSFVELVQKAENGVIDLNNAAAELDVRVWFTCELVGCGTCSCKCECMAI